MACRRPCLPMVVCCSTRDELDAVCSAVSNLSYVSISSLVLHTILLDLGIKFYLGPELKLKAFKDECYALTYKITYFIQPTNRTMIFFFFKRCILASRDLYISSVIRNAYQIYIRK